MSFDIQKEEPVVTPVITPVIEDEPETKTEQVEVKLSPNCDWEPDSYVKIALFPEVHLSGGTVTVDADQAAALEALASVEVA